MNESGAPGPKASDDGGFELADVDAPDAVELAWRRAVGASAARGRTPTVGGRRRWLPNRRGGPDFAGDTATSGAGPGPRDPQLLGDLTTSMISEAGWTQQITVAGVMARWREVVGDDIASRCAPESFTDGLLVIRAVSTAWATQLRYLTGDLASRMADVVGPGVVDRVEVVGPSAPSWRHGKLRTAYGRGARDTYG